MTAIQRFDPPKPSWLEYDSAEYPLTNFSDVYAFPLHEIYLEDEFQQTRSSPNFHGGIVTFATCKHYLRSYRDPRHWIGTWLAGFTPKVGCGDNYLFFLGQIAYAFPSNYDYGQGLYELDYPVYTQKLADDHPCNDVYRPKRGLQGEERWDVENFHEPPLHTRSVEFYDDGTPKWWKDIRYQGMQGRRPPTFILRPAFVWRKPMFVCTMPLYRGGWRVTGSEFHRRLRCVTPR